MHDFAVWKNNDALLNDMTNKELSHNIVYIKITKEFNVFLQYDNDNIKFWGRFYIQIQLELEIKYFIILQMKWMKYIKAYPVIEPIF